MSLARHAWPDRAVAQLGGRQRTIVTHAQLRALEISSRAIHRALDRGRLHPVHQAVYSLVAPGSRPPLAAEQAAVLACGDHAVVSYESGARLHGLSAPAPPEVIITMAGADRRPAGISIHRTRRLTRSERVRVAGLPVTSVARTLVDLCPARGDRALEQLVDEALRRTSRTKLREAAALHARRPGVPRLARLLDPTRPSAETWSKAEQRLLALIRRSGLPLPESNVRLGPYKPDLTWRTERVLVDYDSYEYHSGPRAFGAGFDRHNQLVADGWQVIHVTWEQLTERPEQVLVWIAAALARSGSAPDARRY